MSASHFCAAAELQRALTEQTFAIEHSMIPCSPPGEAQASIVLPEGNEIDIQLTMRGFTIVDRSNSDSESAPFYETIENLLRAVSPLYTEKYQEAIVNALSRLT